MNPPHPANFDFLTISLEAIRHALEQQIARLNGQTPSPPPNLSEAIANARSQMSAPPALDRLCTQFDLNDFDRHLLLLCVGMELMPDFPLLCARAQGNPQRSYPTFGLALTLFPQLSGAWTAIDPASPLRHHHILELDPGFAISLSPLRLDEWALHYLLGKPYLDRRLLGLVKPLPDGSISNPKLPDSQQKIADLSVQTWEQSASCITPAIQLCGTDVAVKRDIAAAICWQLGCELFVMSPQFLPLAPDDLEQVVQLWEREALLCDRVLLIDLSTPEPNIRHAITHFIEHLNARMFIATEERRHIQYRPCVTLDVRALTSAEQRAIWEQTLGDRAGQLNGTLDRVVGQFNLTRSAIQSACTGVFAQNEDDLKTILWDSCRAQTRPRLQDLAQHIPTCATGDDLILDKPQKKILGEIADRVKHRITVYETWGFAAKGSRGLGISALFAGLSGTGKTMAAEVLASQLRLDLYRIDLSAVVSKYIGETEKNLRQVFDAAESSGAILLFDEADALFGKRSDVKDSHDRHANIEVSYLLQRMESYRGLAILTTNLPDALDTAFLRRIQFIVQFPFPNVTEREQIWQQVFPKTIPLDIDRQKDFKKLARLNVAGGNIRSIALNAAFSAAAAGQSVTMKHIFQATQAEYLKLKKQLAEAEVKGWIAAIDS
jgi:ATPase family associated with various cellular activities (AAA)